MEKIKEDDFYKWWALEFFGLSKPYPDYIPLLKQFLKEAIEGKPSLNRATESGSGDDLNRPLSFDIIDKMKPDLEVQEWQKTLTEGRYDKASKIRNSIPQLKALGTRGAMLADLVLQQLQPSPLISNGATAVSPEDVLERNGFDFSAFQADNEYSARNLLLAMVEFASLQSSQALAKQRNEVIEECKSCFSEVFKISPEVDNILKIVEAFKEGFYKLEKLKSPE